MSKKNETLPLILALLITVALLGGGLWLFGRRFINPGGSSPSLLGTSSDGEIQSRLSAGEKVLVPEAANANPQAQAQKQAGVAAIAAKNYAQAQTILTAALATKQNDPETLIYLNNARIADQKAAVIAITVPLDTDVDASLELLRGAAQAQDEINRKGGSGSFLKVLIANDGGTPETARQIATALVADQTVLGVVGHYASDMSLAAGEIYAQGKLSMISPVSSSVKLSNFSPYVFRTVPSDFVAARSLANYMLTQLQQQKAAVFFNSQSGYSQSLKSEFVSALSLGGGQAVSEFDLSNQAFSAAGSLEQATQQGATVLALLTNSGQLDQALQVVQMNRRQLKLLGGDDIYAPKTLAVAGSEALGMVIAVPWHILANPQAPFVVSSRALWKADVNWRTAMSYDATAALIKATAGSPSRESVQQALSSGSFSAPGASGAVKFLPSGDRNQSVQLVKIEPGSRSGSGYDYVPVR